MRCIGNVGTRDDVPLLEAMLSHDEPIVREHVACMLLHTQQRELTRRARQRVYLPTIGRRSSHSCSAPLMDSQ